MSDVKNSSLATNLVSYWELEEASGTRVDSHGSNDLTDVNNVGQTTGVQGSAADFNASANKKLTISNASQTGLDITGDISVSFWVNLTASEFFPAILGRYKTSSADRAYLVVYDTGANKLEWTLSKDGTGTNLSEFSTNTGFSSGTTYHIVCTYDVSTQTAVIYVNGSSVAITETVSAGTVDAVYAGTADFQLGGRDGATLELDGWLDEVGVWSRVLSAGDVTSLYNSGAGIPYDAGGAASTKPNYLGFSRL